MTALMSSGHILLESVPGLAKTTAAQTLASAVSGSFRRIQCTPDLMPNDIVGTQILNSSTGEMTTSWGRSTPTSSCSTRSTAPAPRPSRPCSSHAGAPDLHRRRRLPAAPPLMVLATQNPIEEEGTYVLPEAQTGAASS